MVASLEVWVAIDTNCSFITVVNVWVYISKHFLQSARVLPPALVVGVLIIHIFHFWTSSSQLKLKEKKIPFYLLVLSLSELLDDIKLGMVGLINYEIFIQN